MTVLVRRAAAAAAGSGLAVLLAACGSSGPAAPTVTVTATPPGSASGSSPAQAPGTSAPPAASPAPANAPCPTRALQAKLGLTQGAAGSTYIVIDFKNISSQTCTLYGYPGVSLAGGRPVTQIGLAASENPATPRRLVTIAPGAVANALLRIRNAGNYPASTCGPVMASFLQIYPPNQTTPIYLAFKEPACSKPVRLLTVDAMRPGSGGSG